MVEKIKAYHGTSKAKADKILKSGIFKKETWFALEKEDALKFGGDYIFEAKFDKEGFEGIESWQFWLRETLSLKELRAKSLYK